MNTPGNVRTAMVSTTRSAFSLTTADGISLAAHVWPASGAGDVAVVVTHGFAASKDDGAVLALARALGAQGHTVITYDGRGHGESGGLCTLGDAERHDVAAAVALAHQHAERVVAVGASMGAIAVLRHAALDPALDGVVAVSSPARWRVPRNARSILAAALTQTPPGRVVAERFMRVRLAQGWTRPEAPDVLVRRITAPIAVVHGDDDRFIAPSDAPVLYACANDPRRIDLVPGMGHAFDAPGIPVICAAVDWALATPTPSTLSRSVRS
jgi:pimeloyl-ACP methyl ester carboxylesterase